MRWARRKALLIVRRGDLSEARSLLGCLNDVELLDTVVLRNDYRVDSSTYLRRGKLEELKNTLESAGLSTVYVYDVLKPRQAVSLMREFRAEVRDKVGLILEIFAAHAGSREAKLQIEMADILHKLPLIKEWIRRTKMREFPGFMGPGRYAVDAYYTHIRRRLGRIRRELEELRRRRSIARSLRSRRGMPQVAIAGYANAGKTTLFNRITGESKPTGNEMFTTISPKSKAGYVDGVKVIFVDTVGFIRNVPHEVIEAFYATLEEIALADVTILVVDVSEDEYELRSKLRSSIEILRKIGYVGKPLITALNKVDLLASDPAALAHDVSKFLDSIYPWRHYEVPVSALKGAGINGLINCLSSVLANHVRGARVGSALSSA